MHTSFLSTSALIARATDEALAAAAISATAATVAANTPDPIIEAAKQSAAAVTSAKPIAVKPRTSGRKLTLAKPEAAKPVVVIAKPAKPSKPEAVDVHGTRGTYRGASPSFRQHGRKLSAIVLNRTPGTYTDRDAAFLRDLNAKYATKPFARRDADAGAVSRLIGHGYLRHVSGELDMRDATFAVTAKAVAERLSPKLSGKPSAKPKA